MNDAKMEGIMVVGSYCYSIHTPGKFAEHMSICSDWNKIEERIKYRVKGLEITRTKCT